jgi:hypothetical protein
MTPPTSTVATPASNALLPLRRISSPAADVSEWPEETPPEAP